MHATVACNLQLYLQPLTTCTPGVTFAATQCRRLFATAIMILATNQTQATNSKTPTHTSNLLAHGA
jgi:hypothetical protein